jgi:hypothetical protein
MLNCRPSSAKKEFLFATSWLLFWLSYAFAYSFEDYRMFPAIECYVKQQGID